MIEEPNELCHTMHKMLTKKMGTSYKKKASVHKEVCYKKTNTF